MVQPSKHQDSYLRKHSKTCGQQPHIGRSARRKIIQRIACSNRVRVIVSTLCTRSPNSQISPIQRKPRLLPAPPSGSSNLEIRGSSAPAVSLIGSERKQPVEAIIPTVAKP